MKILHVNHSDSFGGAARAAYRLNEALGRYGLESRMRVNHAHLDDPQVRGPATPAEAAIIRLRRKLGRIPACFSGLSNPIQHSPAFLPSGLVRELNECDADIVNLHWIADEMLSVADIGRIRKPLVWTLHDMWAFCGAEHCNWDGRWQTGYKRGNRPPSERGFDLNRWTWERKRQAWTLPFQIVAPSRWLADCVRRSALMSRWPVAVIPNTLDTDAWHPGDRWLARRELGIPSSAQVLLFGAIGGTRDYVKGFDLIYPVLQRLCCGKRRIELLVIGGEVPVGCDLPGCIVRGFGHVDDDRLLRRLYRAADLTVVPSRLEAFGQSALESQACGTPVLAFATSGIVDVVAHGKSGYLAVPFDAEDLEAGMRWLFTQATAAPGLSAVEGAALPAIRTQARQLVVQRFDYRVVAHAYAQLYRSVLAA